MVDVFRDTGGATVSVRAYHGHIVLDVADLEIVLDANEAAELLFDLADLLDRQVAA